jgi:hypothetical protein
MTKAAITGNYADFKLVKTRSVAQIVIEVPIEQAQEALSLFGIPQPASEIPVAVARLRAKTESYSKPDKPKQKWNDMSYAQRAGILCNDGKFHEYLTQIKDPRGWFSVNPVDYIRSKCVVESRADIDNCSHARETFDKIYESFKAWKNYGYEAPARSVGNPTQYPPTQQSCGQDARPAASLPKQTEGHGRDDQGGKQ